MQQTYCINSKPICINISKPNQVGKHTPTAMRWLFNFNFTFKLYF